VRVIEINQIFYPPEPVAGILLSDISGEEFFDQ